MITRALPPGSGDTEDPPGASPQIAVLDKSREAVSARYAERVAVWRGLDASATGLATHPDSETSQ